MRVALIACSKDKIDTNIPVKAHELYSKSTLFLYSYQYAKKLNCDKIYILSALHGLVPEDKLLEKYDYTLIGQKKDVKLDWAENVLEALQKETDLANDEFIILAGSIYYENILDNIQHYEMPLGTLPLGKRLAFLKEQIGGAPIKTIKKEVPKCTVKRKGLFSI